MDDYISRQAVIKAFENADKDVMANYGEYYGCEWGFSIEAVNQTINSITDADVRPVVRGIWGDDDCCTNCGEEADYNWERGIHYYSNFCPNCGADMREEQDETRS